MSMHGQLQRRLTDHHINTLGAHGDYNHGLLSKKRRGRRTLSSPEQLRQMITEKIRKETLDAFGNGTDVITLMRLKRKKHFVDLSSLEGLRAAYNTAIEREGYLNHALSRAQMECEENKFLFQEAVDCGEQLRLQNLELRTKLDDQLDMVSLMNREVKNLQVKNIILKEEIEDVKLSETESKRALIEITKSNDLAKAELDEQKKLMNKIQNRQAVTLGNFDDNEQEGMDMQDLREQDTRRKLEDALTEARLKLKENEKEHKKVIKRLKRNYKDLEDRLAEIEHRYSEELMRLCFEKAYQEIDYESLLTEVKEKRKQLAEAQKKLSSLGLTGNKDYADSLGRRSTLRVEGPSLADQLELSSVQRNSICSEDTAGFGSEFYEDGSGSEGKETPMNEQPPASEQPDIMQTYLHITATAVLLHFPNLREKVVTTDCLIDTVKNSPFYLYYDLMMHFMYKKKQERALEEAKLKAASRVALAPVESSSWLARLKSLKKTPSIRRSFGSNSLMDLNTSKIRLSSNASIGSETKKGAGDNLTPDRSANESSADEVPRTKSYMF